MTKLHPETVAAWIALATASRSLLEEIEAALKTANLPSLAWYDALLEIERAGETGIRPYELRQKLLLPQYGTSRLIDRIAAAGLIAKLECEDDARGFFVRITDEGIQVRLAMWPVYAGQLTDLVQARITKDELLVLSRLLTKLTPQR
ncbi:MAG: MarR family winged helix-turn-helix transcriptional regulator [Hoeflea sp.]|uniref:MarR family winged helix-turn-helix transcriptional regulator n=1 Tax=Hoeflea sp. TaxID=1940281 RepID=UPI003EF7D638